MWAYREISPPEIERDSEAIRVVSMYFDLKLLKGIGHKVKTLSAYEVACFGIIENTLEEQRTIDRKRNGGQNSS